MSVFGNVSGKDAVEAFQKAGWTLRGQVGSHVIMTKQDVNANLSIPLHHELGPGLLRSLIRTAGLTVEEFLTLL